MEENEVLNEIELSPEMEVELSDGREGDEQE